MIFKYLQLGLLTISNINGQTLMPKKATDSNNTNYTVEPTNGTAFLPTQVWVESQTNRTCTITGTNKIYNDYFVEGELYQYTLGNYKDENNERNTLLRADGFDAAANQQTQAEIDRTTNQILFSYKLTFKNYNSHNFYIPIDIRATPLRDLFSGSILNTHIRLQYLITNSEDAEDVYSPMTQQLTGTGSNTYTFNEYYDYIKETVIQDKTTQTFNESINGTIPPQSTDYITRYVYSNLKLSYTEMTTYYFIGLASLYNNIPPEYASVQTAKIGSTITAPLTKELNSIYGQALTAQVNYEVVNIPGLMFDILTMPFTFISMAFNLTIFPNTAYSINISALFLAILGILVFVMIMRILTKLI